MTNYIYLTDPEGRGYVVQPTMQEPDPDNYKYFEYNQYKADMKLYEEHLASLPRLYLQEKVDWKYGDVLQEGQVRLAYELKDIEGIGRGWIEVSQYGYTAIIVHESCKRILAYPVAAVEKETEMPRCDYELFVDKYFGITEDSERKGKLNVSYNTLVDLVCSYDQKIKEQK